MMTFERLWVLLLLPLPLAWLVWELRRQPRRAPLYLKVGMIVAVILALSEPSLSVKVRKVAVAVLVDTSASVTDADLTRESALLRQINDARGSNRIEVIPFARTPRLLDQKEADFNLVHTAGIEGRGTNLETPIRQALASLPAGMLHRIALITDGNENDGAVTRAAWQAQQTASPSTPSRWPDARSRSSRPKPSGFPAPFLPASVFRSTSPSIRPAPFPRRSSYPPKASRSARTRSRLKQARTASASAPA